MTKKELCRRALRERDKLVHLTLGVKFEDLEQVLKNNGYECFKDCCDYIVVETKTALFDFQSNYKGYSSIDDEAIIIVGVGTISFNQALKIRGEAKHYIVELQNTDDLTDISFYEVETTRTLKQFENEYKRLRNKWLNGSGMLPLIEYLTEELYELGFEMVQITSDLVLDF